MCEVRSSKLALEKKASSEQEFAQRMIHDRTRSPWRTITGALQRVNNVPGGRPKIQLGRFAGVFTC